VSLSTKPAAVAEIAGRAAHIIDAAAVAPGVVRLTVSPGQVRAAVAALLQAGYDAVGSGAQGVLATVPEEPEVDITTAALPEVEQVYSQSGEFLGEIRQEGTGARYWTAAEIAELREAEAAQRAEEEQAEIAAYLDGAKHVADRRAAEPEWRRLGYPDEAAYLDAPGRLTPAAILAAATGHPSGRATRARYTTE
jgi:hypothetical protein